MSQLENLSLQYSLDYRFRPRMLTKGTVPGQFYFINGQDVVANLRTSPRFLNERFNIDHNKILLDNSAVITLNYINSFYTIDKTSLPMTAVILEDICLTRFARYSSQDTLVRDTDTPAILTAKFSSLPYDVTKQVHFFWHMLSLPITEEKREILERVDPMTRLVFDTSLDI